MTRRSPDDEQRLDAAYGRYERALVEGDRREVTEARLLLCRLLADTGWTVPTEVQDQMRRDEKTLRLYAEEPEQDVLGLTRRPSHRQPPRTRKG